MVERGQDGKGGGGCARLLLEWLATNDWGSGCAARSSVALERRHEWFDRAQFGWRH
jgi:hypothetical protein